MKISLVIIAGRDKNNLTRLVKSVEEMIICPHEVIIIFDIKNFGNEIIETPKIKNSVVKTINYNNNGAQPHMRNLAITHSDGDYLWFIDDDVTLYKDALSELLKLIEDLERFPNVGAIAGRIIEENKFVYKEGDKPIRLSLFRGPVGYFNFKNSEFPNHLYECISSPSSNAYPIVPFVQGTSMIFRKIHLQKIGGFNEDLGIGYSSFEDSEVSFALNKFDVKTIYAGSIVLEHHKMKRIGGVSRGHDNYDYATYFIRNYLISFVKNSYPSNMTSFLYVLFFSMGHIFRLTYHINGKSIHPKILLIFAKSLFAIMKGYWLGIGVLLQSGMKRKNTAV